MILRKQINYNIKISNQNLILLDEFSLFSLS